MQCKSTKDQNGRPPKQTHVDIMPKPVLNQSYKRRCSSPTASEVSLNSEEGSEYFSYTSESGSFIDTDVISDSSEDARDLSSEVHEDGPASRKTRPTNYNHNRTSRYTLRRFSSNQSHKNTRQSISNRHCRENSKRTATDDFNKTSKKQAKLQYYNDHSEYAKSEQNGSLNNVVCDMVGSPHSSSGSSRRKNTCPMKRPPRSSKTNSVLQCCSNQSICNNADEISIRRSPRFQESPCRGSILWSILGRLGVIRTKSP